jgi:hypothetical protein
VAGGLFRFVATSAVAYFMLSCATTRPEQPISSTAPAAATASVPSTFSERLGSYVIEAGAPISAASDQNELLEATGPALRAFAATQPSLGCTFPKGIEGRRATNILRVDHFGGGGMFVTDQQMDAWDVLLTCRDGQVLMVSDAVTGVNVASDVSTSLP